MNTQWMEAALKAHGRTAVPYRVGLHLKMIAAAFEQPGVLHEYAIWKYTTRYSFYKEHRMEDGLARSKAVEALLVELLGMAIRANGMGDFHEAQHRALQELKKEKEQWANNNKLGADRRERRL